MKEADYISRTDLGDPDLEFENLRKIGIEEIQRLSGNNWTDFNIHDPGVTILEQLCYAITELGYKTNLDIRDLLASQQDNTENNDTFFTASKILEGKPITLADYRKLLIDAIDGLRDVWIEPLNLNTEKDHLKGMYLVLIKRSPIRITKEEDRERLIRETRSLLTEHSNLGEAFNDILILDEIEIKVSGEIELVKEANVDKIHAQIIYDIQQYISSPVRFHTLDQMLSEGYAMEELFNGPSLMNGFIKDEDLKDRMKVLMTSQLINVINHVDGVAKVLSLKIDREKSNEVHPGKASSDSGSRAAGSNFGPASMKKDMPVDINKVAVLAESMKPYHHKAQPTLTYYQNNEKAHLYRNNYIRYFRQIENENQVKYTQNYLLSNDILPAKGQFKPINEYFSIQEHFPAIYALGKQGIPPSFDTTRANQVRQLKAYLLVFEQILTNYLAQLSNFANLFSLNKELKISYFAGSLETVPYIRELLNGLLEVEDDGELAEHTRKLSKSALEVIDDFYLRKHGVLDHLLARFGEQVSNFGLDQFNYYYDDASLEDVKILAKINYLKELAPLSARRAQSFNPGKEFWTPRAVEPGKEIEVLNTSHLEKKVRIRLGMQMKNKRLVAFLKSNFDDWKGDDPLPILELLVGVKESNETINKKIVLNSIANPLLIKEDFKPGIPIDAELLRRGIWADNYKLITHIEDATMNMVAFSRKFDANILSDQMKEELVIKLAEAGHDRVNYLRFWVEDQFNRKYLIEFEREDMSNYNPVPRNVYVIINEFSNRSDAERYVQSMTNHLAYLNIDMEGFYLVDHIELRPRSERELYGLMLKDKSISTGFISASQFSYAEMQEACITLVNEARVAEVIHDELENGEIETRLVNNGKIIGKYLNLDASQFVEPGDRKSKLDALFRVTEDDLPDPSLIQFYSAIKLFEEINDATFFSFRISIVLPSWPSRFADPEFRKLLETMIREDAPSHIGIDFHYLGFDKMDQFEERYCQWLENLSHYNKNSFHSEEIKGLTPGNANAKPSDYLARLNESSRNLAIFIKDMEDSKLNQS